MGLYEEVGKCLFNFLDFRSSANSAGCVRFWCVRRDMDNVNSFVQNWQGYSLCLVWVSSCFWNEQEYDLHLGYYWVTNYKRINKFGKKSMYLQQWIWHIRFITKFTLINAFTMTSANMCHQWDSIRKFHFTLVTFLRILRVDLLRKQLMRLAYIQHGSHVDCSSTCSW